MKTIVVWLLIASGRIVPEFMDEATCLKAAAAWRSHAPAHVVDRRAECWNVRTDERKQ